MYLDTLPSSNFNKILISSADHSIYHVVDEYCILLIND